MNFAETVKIAAVALASASLIAQSALADSFSPDAHRAWIAIAHSLIDDVNRPADDPQAYVERLVGDCEGVTGKLMSMHAPNAITIQEQGFCMAIHDLAKEVRAQARNGQGLIRGNPAYCGDFDQGIRAAHGMANTPDYADIYPVAQELAAAAQRMKDTELRFELKNGGSILNLLGSKQNFRAVKCR